MQVWITILKNITGDSFAHLVHPSTPIEKGVLLKNMLSCIVCLPFSIPSIPIYINVYYIVESEGIDKIGGYPCV